MLTGIPSLGPLFTVYSDGSTLYISLYSNRIPLNPTPKEGRPCYYRAAGPSFFLSLFLYAFSDAFGLVNTVLHPTSLIIAVHAFGNTLMGEVVNEPHDTWNGEQIDQEGTAKRYD